MAIKKHSHLHILLVGTAVILFWRGAWGLMDLYIFPNNPVISYVVSLLVGLIILFATERFADEMI